MNIVRPSKVLDNKASRWYQARCRVTHIPTNKENRYENDSKVSYRYFLALTVTSATVHATPDEDLLQAIEDGNIAAIQTALQQGANPNTTVKQGDLKGLTALMLAVAAGNSEAVRVLLENKADVDMSMTDDEYKGITALMIAVGEGNPEIVRILLEHGANPNIETKMEEFPSITALEITVSALGEELGRSEREQFFEIIRDLLEYHANIDYVLTRLERNNFNDSQEIAQELRRIQQEVEVKRQQEEQHKVLEQELPKIKIVNTANELYVMGYKWEKTNPQVARAAYQAILDRFPDSDAALRVIERLDQVSNGVVSSANSTAKFGHIQAQIAISAMGGAVVFFDTRTGDLWLYELEQSGKKLHLKLLDLGGELIEVK